jgi:prepilin-type N-terminal cleavage/methylation domain-containing protein
MKLRPPNQRNGGFTLLEVVIVIFVLLILVAMLLPDMPNAPRKAQRISCVNNIKQVGFAYRVWAGDHKGDYPMQVSFTNGGVKELFERGSPFSPFVFLNYLVMSNELSTPRVLCCPADTHVIATTNFSSTFHNGNISYFASPDADESLPQTILSGDDNLAIGGAPVNAGLLELPTNTPIAWTEERHIKAGNIGLADGSAQQVTISGLQQAFQRTGFATNRLAIP